MNALKELRILSSLIMSGGPRGVTEQRLAQNAISTVHKELAADDTKLAALEAENKKLKSELAKAKRAAAKPAPAKAKKKKKKLEKKDDES